MRSFRQTIQQIPPRFGKSLQVRFVQAGDAPVLKGYASTFGGPPDTYGTTFKAGCFKRTLAEHRAEGIRVPMLWCHRSNEAIGSWTRLEEDAKGLYAEGRLNLDTSRGREVASLVESGDVTGLSVGFLVPKDGWEEGPDSLLFTDLDLLEISLTPTPANRKARLDAKAGAISSKRDLVDLLREAGVSKGAAVRIASGGWPALANPKLAVAEDLARRIDDATSKLKGLK